MPEIKWIKLTTDMFDDEKIRIIEALPDADTILIIWVKLLCQAGKVNANGYIFLSEHLPFTDENLSTIFNRPLNTIRLALTTFEKLGMIQIDNNGVIFLPNWPKHQNIAGMERIREQTRERVARHREKQRLLTEGNVTVTLGHAPDKNKNKIRKRIDIDVAPPTQEEIDLLVELQKLTNWQCNDGADLDWLREFLIEFPQLSTVHVHACRDYHDGKTVKQKGIWKARLRNWLQHERKNNERGKHHGGGIQRNREAERAAEIDRLKAGCE